MVQFAYHQHDARRARRHRSRMLPAGAMLVSINMLSSSRRNTPFRDRRPDCMAESGDHGIRAQRQT